MRSHYLPDKHNSNCSRKFIGRATLIYIESLKLLKILVVPKGVEKLNFPPNRRTTPKISDMKP